VNLIRNIGQLLTIDNHKIRVIKDGAICFGQSDLPIWIGKEKEIPSEYFKFEEIDAERKLVTPALVDCHTHTMFAGDRSDEFFLRLSGESYESIAKKGGGIAKTVAQTSKATDQELISLTSKRLDEFQSFGVGMVEIKSGYGLTVEQELRILRLLRKIKHSVQIVPTFLGAHVVPKEYQAKRKEYIRLIIDKMLPIVKGEELSDICDVFCDKTAFTVEESRAVLSAAQKMGMKLKVHADQLSYSGGAELAAELKAISADHLENVSESGVKALKEAGVVAVLLPGAVQFLGKKNYPNARKLLDAGVKVAISTDCNPGTCHTTNLPLMMSLAATELRMTCREIWEAVTVHAARALGLKHPGKWVLWEAQTLEDVPYAYGTAQGRLL